MLAGLAEPQRAQPAIVAEETQNDITITDNLELLDVGVEPRQLLRFQPEEGSADLLSIEMQMSSTISAGGQVLANLPLPPLLMDIAAMVDRIDANGDIYSNFHYDNIVVEDSNEAPASMVEMLRNVFDALSGLQVSTVTDSRGNTKSTDFDVPEDANPLVRQMLEQFGTSFEQLSSPFPAEAVGVGAQWQLRYDTEVSGMRFDTVATYEVVAIEGDLITLDIALAQNAPPQTLSLPGLPPGTSAELLSSKAVGEGQTTIDTSRIVPVVADMDVEMTWIFGFPPGGGRRRSKPACVLGSRL